MMSQRAFQDYYPEEVSHCYGCGRHNEHGLQLKSYWDGDETVAIYEPQPYHCGIAGFVYGGLMASLIDCHAMATAAAATYRAEGREMDSDPPLRFVTGSLKVRYIRPTPMGTPLELRARVKEIKGRKVTVSVSLSANGQRCVIGEAVGVQMPDHMMPNAEPNPTSDS
jgi:acyl-coenzyme A thioesterase PaaI-like protein